MLVCGLRLGALGALTSFQNLALDYVGVKEHSSSYNDRDMYGNLIQITTAGIEIHTYVTFTPRIRFLRMVTERKLLNCNLVEPVDVAAGKHLSWVPQLPPSILPLSSNFTSLK